MGVAWTGTLIAARAAGKSSAFLRVVWSYGILFRAIGFVSPPVLEDDFYRFLWDGRMFAISGTPYGKAPADFFEEPGLGERFEWILNGINHAELPTVYGPVCELAFLAAYLIAPGRLWPLKLMLIVADLAAIALLRRA